MHRRVLQLVLVLAVALAGLAPVSAEVSAGMSGHACCRTMTAAGAPHGGCSQPAKMSCCAPAPDRQTGTQAPPAQVSGSHQPDFTVLKGHAAHVPGLPARVATAVTHAFESSRLKLPHDPLYLRNLVLLV
jgi:hypothetical protein